MNKLKIAFIGCGRISDLHYLGYKDNLTAELYAICDTRIDLLKKRQKEWDVPKIYTDYHDMLKNKDIDAVEILTPQHFHTEMAIACLKAKKHVALQKPMTPTIEEAEKIVNEAQKHKDLILRITDNYLFYPPLVFAKQLIEDGIIGNPQNIRIKMFAGNDTGGWEVPLNSWEWRIKENKAGRPRQTWDHGQHLWSTAWYLMGEFLQVKSWIDYTEDGAIDSPAVVIWKHKGGKKLGMCEYCYSHDIEIPSTYYSCDEWFEVTGPKGLIMVNTCTGELLQGPSVSVFTKDGWKYYSDIESDWASSFVGATHNFVNSILGKEKPLLVPEDGIEILKFSFAIQESDKTSSEIHLD